MVVLGLEVLTMIGLVVMPVALTGAEEAKTGEGVVAGLSCPRIVMGPVVGRMNLC